MTRDIFFERCNRDSITAIMEFIGKYNIVVDDDFIHDQIGIPVTIGPIKTEMVSCACGEYNEQLDSIVINEDEFDREELQDYDNSNVAFYFTKAIIHERLHSLRRREVDEEYYGTPYLIGVEDHLFSKKSCLEEFVTEAMALMITYQHLKNNQCMIDELVDKVKKFQNQEGEGLAAVLIQGMGISGIEWFLTTRYQEHFVDQFASFLGDDYELICDDFEDLYNDNIFDQEQILFLEDIIKGHFKNNSSFINDSR